MTASPPTENKNQPEKQGFIRKYTKKLAKLLKYDNVYVYLITWFNEFINYKNGGALCLLDCCRRLALINSLI